MIFEDPRGLEEFIRRKLWSDWDPIGVNQHPEATGEYDSYVGCIVGLLHRRVGVQRVFEELWKIECVDMGISERALRRQRTMDFAHRLVEETAASRPVIPLSPDA